MTPKANERTIIEMDSTEYERMRAALGKEWEWFGLVRIATIRDPDGGRSHQLRDSKRRRRKASS